MYQFIMNMWLTNRISEDEIQICVERGYITQEEANMILATPQA